ncbi:MAG: hypothetical protein HOB40_02135 [Candidatus Marinimicrobia bacterium]|jgi:hypothetical protein|nr:hypothetical protein [Candidatus Neomarinimicrobiota bacterium]MBT3501671.1 hypothetical protein [Candidatus Neomarinimicrobiota bacterium]MBT3839849.1 hypothetical protein [Candidatus Neomarinimicrobiota bacterium]MBT3998437.1 hypothetical protein [Candidatus Neomarinimicrobiota bacterium]MBT4282243.1 hypothetical protein [Candidatus Neomarinimicrobiota bacterium]
MKSICTYCSAGKDSISGLIPALKRYQSTRIGEIYELAVKQNNLFTILSGKFGLLESSTMIPYYDYLLLDSDVETHAKKVSIQLKKMKITALDYYTIQPNIDNHLIAYSECIRRATEISNVNLTIQIISGL